MSQMGQSLPKWALHATSAYPPTAAVQRTFRHFGYVPNSDIGALMLFALTRLMQLRLTGRNALSTKISDVRK